MPEQGHVAWLVSGLINHGLRTACCVQFGRLSARLRRSMLPIQMMHLVRAQDQHAVLGTHEEVTACGRDKLLGKGL